MFVSTAAKTRPLLALVPFALLREVRSLYSLVSRTAHGKLDRQEVETLVQYLGLDWSHEEMDGYLRLKGPSGVIAFLAEFVRIIEQGVSTGTKNLSVRNWFPGCWYVRERRSGKASGRPSVLILYFQSEEGGWNEAGKVSAPALYVALLGSGPSLTRR